MSKFKIGDKVKIIGPMNGSSSKEFVHRNAMYIGTVGIVCYIIHTARNFNYQIVVFDKSTWYYRVPNIIPLINDSEAANLLKL